MEEGEKKNGHFQTCSHGVGLRGPARPAVVFAEPEFFAALRIVYAAEDHSRQNAAFSPLSGIRKTLGGYETV